MTIANNPKPADVSNILSLRPVFGSVLSFPSLSVTEIVLSSLTVPPITSGATTEPSERTTFPF